MEDYQSNAKKLKKGKEDKDKVEKKIEPVVTDVIIKKKSFGRKFKNMIIEADLRNVVIFVFGDVLIPAAKNTILDMVNRGTERALYGESATTRRRYGSGYPRISYHRMGDREYRGGGIISTTSRYAQTPRSPSSSRFMQEEVIFTDRVQAELVLEKMNDIIVDYEQVSIGDYCELVDRPSPYTDNKWGWYDLREARIQGIREGWIINFPPAELLG